MLIYNSQWDVSRSWMINWTFLPQPRRWVIIFLFYLVFCFLILLVSNDFCFVYVFLMGNFPLWTVFLTFQSACFRVFAFQWGGGGVVGNTRRVVAFPRRSLEASQPDPSPGRLFFYHFFCFLTGLARFKPSGFNHGLNHGLNQVVFFS